MAVANNEKEIQENVIKMRYLEGQANAMQQQMMAAEEIVIESATALNALREIQKLSEKRDSLTPLGGGVFIPGVLEKPAHVLVDVGSGVMAEKTIDEAMKMLEERQSNTRESMKTFDEMLHNISHQYEAFGRRIQELRK